MSIEPLHATASTTLASRFPEAAEAQPEIDLEQLQRHVVVTRRKLRAGQSFYRSGQPFRSLYLVHAGFLKTCELSVDGHEQVTGFQMRGDLLGVESIGAATHSCDAVALEDSQVWELPYPPVMQACLHLPELQARLTAALAREIRRGHAWMLVTGTLSAEQRVAAFLLDLSTRLAQIGFSGSHFILRMGRADIASFLALKHETVSRALSHFEKLGHILVQRREIRLLEIPELRVFAGATGTLQ